MPKPKPITFGAFTDDAARAESELWSGVNAVLLAANVGPTQPQKEALHRALVSALEHLSEGTDVHLPGDVFRLRSRVAFDNLKALVLSGQYHIGRCRECSNWFLATDKRQRICKSRPACQQAVNREHKAVSRRHEQRMQRLSLETVSRKRTKRTK